MRVLVVDDNRDAALMLAEAMDSFGYDARVASDGPAALEAATRFNPHAVLLDLGLPVMDWYEVADRLRASGISVPLLAVTGYGQETDRARSETAGFVAHFVKPVDLEELKHHRAVGRQLFGVSDRNRRGPLPNDLTSKMRR